jgi:hypothetical protein
MSTPWPIGNPFLARRAVAIALVALVLPSFASCNHEPQITEVDYLYAEPGKVYFFNQPKDRDDDDDAEITGTLLLVDGCLRIETPYVAPDWYSAVVWPKEYDLVIEEREIAILNPDGERVTRVGDVVLIGGSGAGTDRDDRIGECRGPFWHANTNDTVKTLATATPN